MRIGHEMQKESNEEYNEKQGTKEVDASGLKNSSMKGTSLDLSNLTKKIGLR